MGFSVEALAMKKPNNRIKMDRQSFGVGEEKQVRKKLKDISVAIKLLRIRAGLSQDQLALVTRSSASTIRSIEQGQRVPSLPMILKLDYYFTKYLNINYSILEV